MGWKTRTGRRHLGGCLLELRVSSLENVSDLDLHIEHFIKCKNSAQTYLKQKHTANLGDRREDQRWRRSRCRKGKDGKCKSCFGAGRQLVADITVSVIPREFDRSRSRSRLWSRLHWVNQGPLRGHSSLPIPCFARYL